MLGWTFLKGQEPLVRSRSKGPDGLWWQIRLRPALAEIHFKGPQSPPLTPHLQPHCSPAHSTRASVTLNMPLLADNHPQQPSVLLQRSTSTHHTVLWVSAQTRFCFKAGNFISLPLTIQCGCKPRKRNPGDGLCTNKWVGGKELEMANNSQAFSKTVLKENEKHEKLTKWK